MNDYLQEAEIIEDVIPVDKGLRFANFLIDLIFFYGVLFTGAISIGVIAAVLGMGNVFEGLENIPTLLDRLLTMVLYACFMAFQEVISGGRSLGKLITGTKVVTSDGYKPEFSVLFTRNLSRAVPFDNLSFLGGGTGWHDKWSDTTVVKK
jgi:uncharacterized RDD family membrane protein YckC